MVLCLFRRCYGRAKCFNMVIVYSKVLVLYVCVYVGILFTVYTAAAFWRNKR